VQGNVGIHEKGNVALFDVNLEHYRELSAPLQSQVDLLIWPESVAQWWTEVGDDHVSDKHNPYIGTSAYLIYGGLAFQYPEEGGEALMYNSAFLIDGAGRVFGRYDKHVLIPFGEYIPFGSLAPSVYDLSPQTSHFTPGKELAPLQVPGLLRRYQRRCPRDVRVLAPPLREIGELVRRLGQLTIFNDAWFGRSMAPYQHGRSRSGARSRTAATSCASATPA
jgi:apolipoprotein N-acyltransferase